MQQSINRLQYLCDTIPGLLLAIDEQSFNEQPQPDKWSKKEILGHLIDSATNNHQRFVRGQFEETPFIKYDQNAWNKYSYYQQADQRQLVAFWEQYNRHLLSIISHMSEHMPARTVNTGKEYTLAFLIEDYVVHMEHHLKQIVTY